MTREEIAHKLVEIVKQEKDIPDDKLTPETVLADAGIDSLDALTILFGSRRSSRSRSPTTVRRRSRRSAT